MAHRAVNWRESCPPAMILMVMAIADHANHADHDNNADHVAIVLLNVACTKY